MVLALLSASSSYAQAEPTDASLSLARERERAARLELEAARSKKFYLVADVGASTLSLKLSGVDLTTYELRSVDVGAPLAKGGSKAELDELYSCQSSVVEAPSVIQPGLSPPADPVGEPLEKPGPERVTLSCEPSLSIHLASDSASSLRDRFRLPGDVAIDRRVRIVLKESDAERLFAALPSDILLLFSRLPKDVR